MKLNYKRTVFVGFAFFLICSFWQAYDNTIPLILTNKFGMSQAWSGVIMALDNVLALFMLPLFGAISDKHHSKWGRRTPFIVVGTLIAAVMLIALSFVDNAQLKHLSDVSAIDDPAALEQIYDRQAGETLLTPGGDKFVLSQKFTQEEFCQIRSQVEQNGSTVTNPGNGYDDSVDYDALKGQTITVAASPTPHAEILEVAKEILAAKGITLDIQVYNDYVVPNTVVDDGTLDANYFQHLPYLEDFNAENNTHIVSVSAIHVEPMGLYGGLQTSLDALKASK
jgi:hypothetical protein